MKKVHNVENSDFPSSEITQALIAAINEIGAGEEILVFKDVKQEFMLFTASFNGRIKLSMNNGDVECEFTRQYTGAVVDDFNLAHGILELPLKIVRKDPQGQIQVDGEPEIAIVSDIDGLPSPFDAPLMDRVLKTLEAFQFDIQPRPNEDDEDTEKIRTWDLISDFRLRLILGEKDETLTLEARKTGIPMDAAYAFANQSSQRMPLLVRPTLYNEASTEPKLVTLDFTSVIPSMPFVGQHLMTALTSIIFAMDLWREFEGE